MIGGGPAGLTAAYQLCKAGLPCVVLEKDSVVGGLSRTVDYKGYLFDIGGHRFFTKIKRVNQMWEEVLSERDFTVRPRLSRIYYNNKFFHYPLRPMNALLGLGVWNSVLILLSYIYVQFFPERPEDTFEQWVSNRFGPKGDPPLKRRNNVATKMKRPSVDPKEIPSATLSSLAKDSKIKASVLCSSEVTVGVAGALGKTTLLISLVP